jgi:hypothetical protein
LKGSSKSRVDIFSISHVGGPDSVILHEPANLRSHLRQRAHHQVQTNKARHGLLGSQLLDQIHSEGPLRLFVFQIVDEAALVEFLDELAVDEILWLCLFSFRVVCNQRVNYGLEAGL